MIIRHLAPSAPRAVSLPSAAAAPAARLQRLRGAIQDLKYRPQFPRHFGSLEDGRTAREFFDWYNPEHHHSALAWLAPATVHQGGGAEALRHRLEILLDAYQEHPERVVNGPPFLAQLPEAAWINPPERLPDRSLTADHYLSKSR